MEKAAKLLLGVQAYLQAKDDVANAQDLCQRLEDLKCTFDRVATDVADALYLASPTWDNDLLKKLAEYFGSGTENESGELE